MLTHAYVNGTQISINDFKKDVHLDPRCPMGHELIGKKGSKVVYHFAHKPGTGCDPFREGMTNWHRQWQEIVADERNLEVCLDDEGRTLGYSSFNGYRPSTKMHNLTTTPHIADIIRPDPDPQKRPLVIEIQHSPINEENVLSRDAYYQNMIWVFDFSPRVVKLNTQGPKNFNRVAFVDGKMVGLMDKIGYLACLNTVAPLGWKNSHPCSGDYGEEVEKMYGVFLIVHTRTKYWFVSGKPTYFDTGFGILRLLKNLYRGFALTMFISYKEFFVERMPAINQDRLEACEWFKDFNIFDLNKLGLLPPMTPVSSIAISKDRLEILYPGKELQEMGFQLKITKEHPNGVWCAGSFYDGLGEKGTDPNKSKSEEAYLQELQMREQIAEAMYGRVGKIQEQAVALSFESMLITRLCKFLGLNIHNVHTEIILQRGNKVLVLHCNKETYKLKEKFKAIGMEYKPGSNKKTIMVDGRKPKKDPTYRADLDILDKSLRALGN